ncbi:histidine kinase [Mesorhizobium sp. CN2-181]
MPTLSRFVMFIGIVVLIVYAAMFALATFVTPRQGEMTVDVPIGDRIAKP